MDLEKKEIDENWKHWKRLYTGCRCCRYARGSKIALYKYSTMRKQQINKPDEKVMKRLFICHSDLLTLFSRRQPFSPIWIPLISPRNCCLPLDPIGLTGNINVVKLLEFEHFDARFLTQTFGALFETCFPRIFHRVLVLVMPLRRRSSTPDWCLIIP